MLGLRAARGGLTAGGSGTAATGPAAAPVGSLFLGVLVLSIGVGLENSLLGLRAVLEGFPTTMTGMLMVAYYAGFLIGAVATPRLVGSVGHVRVFAAGAALTSVAALLHGQLAEPVPWLVLRLVSGASVAGLLVVAESWLNAAATNATRGRLLSVYSVVLMGGLGAGPLLLNVADLAGTGLFVLTSVLISLALVPVVLGRHPAPEIAEVDPVPVRRLLADVPLGVMVSVGIGVAHGMLLGMGAVYGRAAGLGVAEVSLFLGVTILGSTLLQFPLGAISDREDRRVVIGAVSLVASGAALATTVLTGQSGVAFYAAAALFGGLSLPLYSLGIAHVNDWLSPRQRVPASASLVRLNGVGLALGPLVAAFSLDWLGAPGFFLCQTVLHLGVAAYAAHRVRTVPARRRGHRHVPFPARGVSLAAVLLSQARARTRRRIR